MNNDDDDNDKGLGLDVTSVHNEDLSDKGRNHVVLMVCLCCVVHFEWYGKEV
jgi:hypothetical protein